MKDNKTNMEAKDLFAKRLKQARQKAGLSMDGLSAKTGKEVSKQTISKYEAGKTMAGSSILIKLSKALDVPVDYFFRPYAFDVSEVEISFRKKASIGAKDQTILKIKIQDEVERFKIHTMNLSEVLFTNLKEVNLLDRDITLLQWLREHDFSCVRYNHENDGNEIL